MTKANEIIQWAGTAFVLTMYAIMNLFPEFTVGTQVAGLLGAMCFFAWTVRVKNYPQMTINAVAMTLCVTGLVRHFG
jgi:hypothetical protein